MKDVGTLHLGTHRLPECPKAERPLFFKVVGSGNDFILVDARRRPLPGTAARLARDWCDRSRGIGADGLLVLSSSAKADARMRVYNPDGSEASMCGNGLRCVAWYLHTEDHGRKHLRIETGAGVLQAQIVGSERVRIFAGTPRQLRLGLSLRHQGRRFLLHAVNSGVPHAVLFTSRMETVQPSVMGPVIRHHRLFRPEGTNVDWVQVHSPHAVSIRTYERGVEQETLACGTGAVAAVVIGAALGRLVPPVRVRTRGGETLQVGFRRGLRPWQDLTLEGPARILFEGGFRRGSREVLKGAL